MTAAFSAAAVGAAASSAWPWPIDLERYPRKGQLSVTELDGLRALGLELLRSADRDLGSVPWQALRKLVQPLDDASSRCTGIQIPAISGGSPGTRPRSC